MATPLHHSPLWFFIVTGLAGVAAHAEFPIFNRSYDALDRLTNVNSRFVNQSYRYDASGNRTNYSVEMSFAVAPLANRKIASDATLSVPLATTGDLLIPFARWTIRSSNRELVPKSGLQVVDEGTTAPTLRITPAPGEVGTTRITVIAINAGSRTAATATSFVLTVGGNRPPLAINDSAQHPPGGGTKIERKKLLANDSDPDNDPLTLASLSATSAHGGLVRFFGPFVSYDPPPGYDGPDFFNYSILDSHGAAATASVRLISQPSGLAIPSTVVETRVLDNGHRWLAFIGLPDSHYAIEASADLVDWIEVGQATADSRGYFMFEDAEAATYPVRFYRTIFR